MRRFWKDPERVRPVIRYVFEASFKKVLEGIEHIKRVLAGIQLPRPGVTSTRVDYTVVYHPKKSILENKS